MEKLSSAGAAIQEPEKRRKEDWENDAAATLFALGKGRKKKEKAKRQNIAAEKEAAKT